MAKMNNMIDFNRLKTDSAYKSRIILLGYALFFVVLIIILRFGNTNDGNTNKKNNDNNTNINENTDNTKTDDFKEFANIRNGIFNFVYTLNINDDLYISTGKKYNQKESFTLTESKTNRKLIYLVYGNDIVAKLEDGVETDSTYVIASKPVTYIDYFDHTVLEKIIKESTYNKNDDTYEIINSKLVDILEYNSERVKDKEATNKITLEKKNNNIISIKMDYSNFAKEFDETITEISFSLEYTEFNLVDDFDITYE